MSSLRTVRLALRIKRTRVTPVVLRFSRAVACAMPMAFVEMSTTVLSGAVFRRPVGGEIVEWPASWARYLLHVSIPCTQGRGTSRGSAVAGRALPLGVVGRGRSSQIQDQSVLWVGWERG